MNRALFIRIEVGPDTDDVEVTPVLKPIPAALGAWADGFGAPVSVAASRAGDLTRAQTRPPFEGPAPAGPSAFRGRRRAARSPCRSHWTVLRGASDAAYQAISSMATRSQWAVQAGVGA
jgi:hypothetical protein